MDLDFWSCFVREKSWSHNQRNMVSFHKCTIITLSIQTHLGIWIGYTVPPCFSTILSRKNNFYDLLFAFLVNETLSVGNLLQKKEFAPGWASSFI